VNVVSLPFADLAPAPAPEPPRSSPWFESLRATWARARGVLITLLIIVLAQVTGFAVACRATDQPPPRDPAVVAHEQEIKAEIGYSTELLNCTKNSPTLAESKQCEEKVDEQWRVKRGWVLSDPKAPAAGGRP